jgi:hypothetical protein
MHAVFAKVKQQSAEQDQDEPRLDPAGQKREPQDGDTCQKRGHTAVTKKHEEHFRPSSRNCPVIFNFPWAMPGKYRRRQPAASVSFGGLKMCGSFLFRVQRRFLRSQFSDQRLDPFDGELVGHRRFYFLVVLDLFVELVACVAHPKVPPLAADKGCC